MESPGPGRSHGGDEAAQPRGLIVEAGQLVLDVLELAAEGAFELLGALERLVGGEPPGAVPEGEATGRGVRVRGARQSDGEQGAGPSGGDQLLFPARARSTRVRTSGPSRSTARNPASRGKTTLP